MSNSVQPYGLQPSRFLCPWDSPGKNTAVGCHALLQGISLIFYSLQTKNGHTKVIQIPISVCTNEVLLHPNHICSFACYLWLLLHQGREIQQLQQRPDGLPSPKYLLSGPLQNCLLISTIEILNTKKKKKKNELDEIYLDEATSHSICENISPLHPFFQEMNWSENKNCPQLLSFFKKAS